LLSEALNETDDEGRKWADAKWGVYAFYDYEGEPIYVGQTNEQLRVRVRRHLTNQRTDAVAMRVLDVFEVAELAFYPLWDYQTTPGNDPTARKYLNTLEYSTYLDAIANSRYKAILNEVIPPVSDPVPLPPGLRRTLISAETRAIRGHPDTRIARRAETISRLAAVAHERGEVSDGLRRVLVIQAVRIAHLAATRLAEVEGREPPPAEAIDMQRLVGSVLQESLAGIDLDSDALATEELGGFRVIRASMPTDDMSNPAT
jgi:GIY-YIG catalytic domain-containing protein